MPSTRTASLVSGALTLAVVALLHPSPAKAAPPTEELVTVTPGSELLNTADTRSTGHVEYTKFGLHVWTEGATSTDKAAGYVAVDYPLSEVGSPSIEWLYNEPLQLMKPGMQIVLDKDGDGNFDGIVVGEPWAYGDDWWSGSAGLSDSGLSCPSGCGSTNSGTLDEWRTAYPDAQVIAVGFSLGSGAHGNGTLISMTYGSTRYEFTNVEPVTPEVVVPTAQAKAMKSRCDRARIRIAVDDIPEGSVSSAPKVRFVLKDGDRVAARSTLTPGSHATMRQNLGNKKPHVYRVYADGSLLLKHWVTSSCA